MGRVLDGLALAGLCAVLLGAYVMQFALGEAPCPLCTLQRVAFGLAMFGFLLNVRIGPRPLHYGAVLAAAALGMLVSGRQTLLHVVPGTGVYGSAVLGLHLYVWAFILFAAMVPGTALLLALHRPGPAAAAPRWGRPLCWAAVAITVANAVTIFLQCGPTECSDDPMGWWIAGTNR